MTISSVKPWDVTIDTVYKTTRVKVHDDRIIDTAADLIELWTGLIGADLTRWSQTRLEYLKRATEYQAAWLTTNYREAFSMGIFTELESDSVKQRYGAKATSLMSPYAYAALRQLSSGMRSKIKTYGAVGATGIEAKAQLKETLESTPDTLFEDDDDADYNQIIRIVKA